MLVAASPIFGLHIGANGVSTLPSNLPSKQGYVLLQKTFPVQNPEPVRIVAVGGSAAAVHRDLERLNRRLVADAKAMIDDPLAGDAFPRLWTQGRQADAAQMKLAAAAILVQTKPTAKQDVTMLEDAQKNALSDAEKASVNPRALDRIRQYRGSREFAEGIR